MTDSMGSGWDADGGLDGGLTTMRSGVFMTDFDYLKDVLCMRMFVSRATTSSHSRAELRTDLKTYLSS